MTKKQKPKLLDLYCCQGGGSAGYARAGFDVYGSDFFQEHSQKRYPFPAYKGDAIAVMNKLAKGEKIDFEVYDAETKKFKVVATLGLEDFDVLAGSPPCQHASIGTAALRKKNQKTYPHMIPPTRDFFIASGKPYIIENVKGSDLHDPVELCGCMFDLKAVDTDGILLHLQRARRFESNIPLTIPKPHDHSDHEWVAGSYGGARKDKYDAKFVRKGGYVPSIPVQQQLLGIDWMSQTAMYQSLPPVYTQYLGNQVLKYLKKQNKA